MEFIQKFHPVFLAKIFLRNPPRITFRNSFRDCFTNSFRDIFINLSSEFTEDFSSHLFSDSSQDFSKKITACFFFQKMFQKMFSSYLRDSSSSLNIQRYALFNPPSGGFISGIPGWIIYWNLLEASWWNTWSSKRKAF